MTRRTPDLPQPPRVVGRGTVKRARRYHANSEDGPSAISREFCAQFLRNFDQVFCAKRPWLRDQQRDCFGSHGGFGMVRAADRKP